jgi:S1-C subfamily serine protease
MEEDGPAETAGLWVEDLVIGYAGRTVASVDDLHRHLTQLPVGEPQPVDLIRDGQRITRRVVPRDYPRRD